MDLKKRHNIILELILIYTLFCLFDILYAINNFKKTFALNYCFIFFINSLSNTMINVLKSQNK